MGNKIKMGIVGYGNMGVGHAHGISKGDAGNIELAAICDHDPERLAVAEEKHPDVARFLNAGEMYKSGLVDSVLIAVPHYDHSPLAVSAFEHGLNVMCEKPAGVYTKQVLEMNEAAKKSGKTFGIMFNQRTDPAYIKLRELVKGGELGHIKKIIWIVTDWYRPEIYHQSGSWRSTWSGEGGGTIINQNPHNLDLWQWIFGMPNKLASFCSWGKYYDIECEDDVTAYFEYDSGTTGIYTTSTAESPGTNRLEISADMGKVVVEKGEIKFFRNTVSEREFNKNNMSPFGRPEAWECIVPVPKTPEIRQHDIVLSKFANAVLNGGELIAEGVDGIYEMTVSNAIYLSDWLGNVKIDLNNFDHDKFYELLMEKVKNSKPKNVKKIVVEQ
jgi:predicted dehydrogenase